MAIEGMFFDAIESGGTYDREYSSGDFSRYLELIVGLRALGAKSVRRGLADAVRAAGYHDVLSFKTFVHGIPLP